MAKALKQNTRVNRRGCLMKEEEGVHGGTGSEAGGCRVLERGGHGAVMAGVGRG